MAAAGRSASSVVRRRYRRRRHPKWSIYAPTFHRRRYRRRPSSYRPPCRRPSSCRSRRAALAAIARPRLATAAIASRIHRTCTGSNCEPHFEPPQKPTKQASLTDKSRKYVEPEHRKPIKQASLTDESHNYVEPEHRKPIKQASLTDKSHKYVEPEHRKPIKQASLTDESHKYVEPEHRKPIKQASLTDESHKYVQPERRKPAKQASLTDESHKYVQPAPKHSGGKPEISKFEFDSPEWISPVQCPNLNLSGCGQEIQEQAKREAEQKKKAEEEREKKEKEQYALDHDVDSKNCNKLGGRSMALLRSNPRYTTLVQCITDGCKPTETSDPSFNKLALAKIRDASTGIIAAVPTYGGALSGVIKLLWDDPTPDAVFDQLKKYVKSFVSEKISGEHYKNLQAVIDGMNLTLGDYHTYTEPLAQGPTLLSMDSTLAGARKLFHDDPDHAAQLLPYFVAFGTLHLAVLRELYLNTKDYYCPAGKDYNNSQKCADQHHAFLVKLNKAITDYTKDAQTLKDDAIAWRLKKIYVNTGERRKVSPGIGVEREYSIEDFTTANAVDDFCGTSLWSTPTYEQEIGYGDNSAMVQAQADVDARKATATKGFGENLDFILAPLAHWASFTDQAAPATAPGRQAAR